MKTSKNTKPAATKGYSVPHIPKETTHSTTQKLTTGKLSIKLLVNSCIAAAVIAISLYLYLTSPFSPRNLAAEVAKPLEEALIKAGGVKKCQKGDPGFGPDNWRPAYTGVYQMQVGREKALEIVTKTARDNGYNLKTDKPTDDVNKHVILKDDSKQNQYKELEEGQMLVSAIIDAYGDDGTCGGEPLLIAENQTVLLLQVSLPDRKK